MLPVHSTFLKPVALAALLSGLSLAAQAQLAVDVVSLRADGSYQFGGQATATLLSQTSTGSVDVIGFPGFNGYSAVLHSYGDNTGNFGSRSSGVGVYDVTGGFSIALDIRNNGGTAQRVNFGFHITPGYLSNGVIGFNPGQFVESGISFDIKKGLGAATPVSIWSTSGQLRSDTSGTTFSETESDNSINLFDGTGTTRSVLGKSYNLDLGVLNAGESMVLTYDIRSSAKGDAINGTVTTVPPQTVHVPDQWVEFCSGGYGYGGYGGYGDNGGYGGFSCEPQLIPAHDVVVEGYTTFEGAVGSSQAGSGDPFDISSSDGQPYDTFQRPTLPPGVAFGLTANPVPEPGTYGLMALGLLAVGLRARRKR